MGVKVVGVKVVGDKVVCQRGCVTKLRATKLWVTKLYVKEGAAKEGEEAEVGYRIKNKNLTQRCGEKRNHKIESNPTSNAAEVETIGEVSCCDAWMQSESTDGPKGGWSCAFWNGCSGHLNHNFWM